MSTVLINDNSSNLLAISLFFVVLALLLISNIFMWVSLAKQGDERRKFILTKTCAETFLIHTFTLVIDVIARIFFNNDFIRGSSTSSIIPLGVISIIFTIVFFINKRRYGD